MTEIKTILKLLNIGLDEYISCTPSEAKQNLLLEYIQAILRNLVSVKNPG